jgi:hypothetical protein
LLQERLPLVGHGQEKGKRTRARENLGGKPPIACASRGARPCRLYTATRYRCSSPMAMGGRGAPSRRGRAGDAMVRWLRRR